MEAKNDIMISYRFPRWDDLPVFELYVDQVCALLNERLSPIMKLMGEETPLTPAMVNNYVKQGVINPPVKKKYCREQLCQLGVVIICKMVLPMKQIGDSIAAMMRVFEVSEGYDLFFGELEYSVRSAFAPQRYPPKTIFDAATREEASMRALAGACAQMLLLWDLIRTRRSEEAAKEENTNG